MTSKIDELGEAMAQRDALRLHYDALREQIMEKVRGELMDLDAEAAPEMDAVNARINELTKAVTDETLAAGETVRGVHVMAVYSKGRTSWNTKALDGYAAAHPEIEQFKTTGAPSVSFRATGN